MRILCMDYGERRLGFALSDEAQILFCGMAIGYRDEAAAVNNFERDRAPLSRQVRFIGFDEEGPQ